MKNFFLNNRLIILLLLFVVMLTPIAIYVFSPKQAPPKQEDQAPQEENQQPQKHVSSLQKTIIGKTGEQDVNSLSGFLKKETLPSGQIKYSFESPLSARPNEILINNGIVVFEKELVPVSPSSTGYTTISQTTATFGQPEKIFNGSKFYGWVLKHYIYSSQGFAFVGNPNNDEIYEFDFFKPTTVENYVSLYGGDISRQSSPPQE